MCGGTGWGYGVEIRVCGGTGWGYGVEIRVCGGTGWGYGVEIRVCGGMGWEQEALVTFPDPAEFQLKVLVLHFVVDCVDTGQQWK